MTYLIKKKNSIKIPKNIKVIYSENKNLLTFSGPLRTKSIKLNMKIIITQLSIIVTNKPSIEASNQVLKNFKRIQGTTVALIKQSLIEINYLLFNKLNLIGVGYRVFNIDDLQNQIYFKLGYSHLVYFKIQNPISSFCLKHSKLFLFGNCEYSQLTNIASQIRKCKMPEPYKGKGILYNNETIILKKGKKI
jgi:large subunit ribosomal protein L6